METTETQNRGAFASPWPYTAIALLSIVTSPMTFGFTLLLGITVGMFGALGHVLSRTESGRARGAHVLIAGLSILAGPAAYLVLAVIVALVG
jgi:hypothetical protein